MANTELATAYISILPSTRGFVPSLSKQLGNSSGMEKTGKTLGSRLTKGLKVSAIGAATAIGGVLAKSVIGGFKRLTAIENAEAKLTGLGHSAKNVDRIMGDALKSVKGTAFGLDEAASVAASTVAAGVKPGKELEGVLRLVADAATIGGASMGEMGAIFNKVAASNKVQGEVIAQLNDRGIPIIQLLSKELGTSAEETVKLASKGKINFETFRKAMENGLGGAALKSGETTVGAFKNMNAALSRFGVTLLEKVFPYIGPAMKKATDAIDAAGDRIEPVLDTIAKGVEGAYELLVNGNFTSAFREAFHVEEDSAVVGFLFDFRDGLAAVSNYFTGTALPALERFGGWLSENRAAVKVAAGVLLAVLVPALVRWGTEALIAGAKHAKAWTMASKPVKAARFVGETYKMIGAWTRLAAAALKSGAESAAIWTMYRVEAAKAGAASVRESAKIIGRWALMSAQSMIHAGRMAAAWVIAMGPVGWAIAAIAGIAAVVALNWDKIVSWTSTAWGAVMDYLRPVGEWISGKLGPVFAWLRDTATAAWSGISSTVGTAASAVVSTFQTVVGAVSGFLAPIFTWLYEKIVRPIWAVIAFAIDTAANVALLAFDLFVYGMKHLAPVFTWLYENIVKPVWTWIGDKISAAWGIVKGVFGFVTLGIKALGLVFRGLYDGFVKPVWNWIADKISLGWKIWRAVFVAVGAYIRDNLGPVFRWIYDSVIKPVWNWIADKFRVGWIIWKGIFKAVHAYLKDTLGPIFKWLYEKVIRPAWDGIKKTISTVWTKGLKPVFKAIGGFLKDTLVPAFETAVDNIGKAWDGLKSLVKKPVKFIIETVYNNGIVGTFNKIAEKIDSSARLKTIPLPKGFATGGYTGAGTKYQEAGVVHAGEYVFRKETTEKLRRAIGLSGLDHINRTGEFPGYATGGLVKRPVGGRVTSRFGSSRGKYPHAGTDFAVPIGTAVRAAMDGIVRIAKWNAVSGRSGKGMLLEHAGGRNTYYGHLSAFVAKVGQMVKQGQTIARSGNTGRSTGPHLHFETWTGGKPVNPELYLGKLLPEGVGGGGGLLDWIRSKVDALSGVKDRLLGKFTSKFPRAGLFVDAAKHMGKEVFRILPDALMSKVKAVGDWIGDKAGALGGAINSGTAKAQVRAVAATRGWGLGAQWSALDNIISRESGWNPNAANPSSSARGLFQKMTSIHGPVAKTAAGQAKWGLDYIASRYGNPVNAWNHWQRYGSYSDGGLVTPTLYDGGGWLRDTGGPQLIDHQRRKPDAVLTNEEWRSVHRIAESVGANGREPDIHIGQITIPVKDLEEIRTVTDFVDTLRRRARQK